MLTNIASLLIVSRSLSVRTLPVTDQRLGFVPPAVTAGQPATPVPGWVSRYSPNFPVSTHSPLSTDQKSSAIPSVT